MVKGENAKELFTASEVARFCQVDLKTIHNWAERGEVRHFRTPGRHLRFRRVDVLDFLRKYGYPIPEELQQGKPRVVLIEDDPVHAEQNARALEDRFDVERHTDPVRALISIGADAPDVVVVDEAVGGLDGVHIIECINDVDATRHVRTVLFSNDFGRRSTAVGSGASARVTRSDKGQLRETLEALMGLER
ncbi:MAG: helix-turn-helix domain-containing protein [Myxococcota bacterium]